MNLFYSTKPFSKASNEYSKFTHYFPKNSTSEKIPFLKTQHYNFTPHNLIKRPSHQKIRTVASPDEKPHGDPSSNKFPHDFRSSGKLRHNTVSITKPDNRRPFSLFTTFPHLAVFADKHTTKGLAVRKQYATAIMWHTLHGIMRCVYMSCVCETRKLGKTAFSNCVNLYGGSRSVEQCSL